jgi:hypothetical protein
LKWTTNFFFLGRQSERRAGVEMRTKAQCSESSEPVRNLCVRTRRRGELVPGGRPAGRPAHLLPGRAGTQQQVSASRPSSAPADPCDAARRAVWKSSRDLGGGERSDAERHAV